MSLHFGLFLGQALTRKLCSVTSAYFHFGKKQRRRKQGISTGNRHQKETNMATKIPRYFFYLISILAYGCYQRRNFECEVLGD